MRIEAVDGYAEWRGQRAGLRDTAGNGTRVDLTTWIDATTAEWIRVQAADRIAPEMWTGMANLNFPCSSPLLLRGFISVLLHGWAVIWMAMACEGSQWVDPSPSAA